VPEVNCIFTKALIPFVERTVGPAAAAAIVGEAGHPREWLVADHNWIPLALADRLVRLAMQLMGEDDEERWARRYGEYFMDWKPSREERSYLGTYSMGIGHPRRLFQRVPVLFAQQSRSVQLDVERLGRRDAVYRAAPRPGVAPPRWLCIWLQVELARFPTNWGLPRARVVERQCAARGADACVWHVRWTNPPLGLRFWGPVAGGAAAAVLAALSVALVPALRGPTGIAAVVLLLLLGVALGQARRDRHRRRHAERLLELQSDEIIYSNSELERKFADLEALSRGLEDTVRVRTEQLRTANEELRAAYRDLQATQRQLIQREKMASVGQLVAGVAHELNNPIGFVSSNVVTLDRFVQRLRAMLEAYDAVALPDTDRARLDARRRELQVDYALKYLDTLLGGIREGAERTRKIVGDLRVFARTSDESWERIDLHEELESSLTLLTHVLEDRVTVRRDYGPLGPVEAVRSQIDQVLVNVLANAAQAIRGPGVITIETRRDGPMAVVTIRDSGPGIAPADLGRIFDPFFTTKPAGQGTGLGLSISYEIMKRHRGDIRAENLPDGGAAFTLRLPLAGEDR
jgi:signal transduction histidine kinase